MKKLIIILLTITATIAYCVRDHKYYEAILESSDLSDIKEKRSELNQQQRDLKSDLEKLNAYIESHEKDERPALVTAEVVSDTIFKHYVEVQGNVQTDQNVVLNAEYSGVLTNIFVKEGQQVSKGQRLAKIDDGGQIGRAS